MTEVSASMGKAVFRGKFQHVVSDKVYYNWTEISYSTLSVWINAVQNSQINHFLDLKTHQYNHWASEKVVRFIEKCWMQKIDLVESQSDNHSG